MQHVCFKEEAEMRRQDQKRQGRMDSNTQDQAYDESDPERAWNLGTEVTTQGPGRRPGSILSCVSLGN